MRRLKKADCEVDFVFINEVESFPLTVNPQAVLGTLGEIAEVCQDFFDSIQTAFGNSPNVITGLVIFQCDVATRSPWRPLPNSLISSH